ncbi:MAG TPA: HPr family phosphocarrier protein [Alphaproteobacteria bacterium]
MTGGAGSGRGRRRRVRRKATILGELGLHARPAARFVELASRFEAEVRVSCKGTTVSGRSIMGLMMLAAGGGAELIISASGPEADAAVEALSRFVQSGFRAS